jgi:hypothetical protein
LRSNFGSAPLAEKRLAAKWLQKSIARFEAEGTRRAKRYW